MKTINLKKYYYPICKKDTFVEVPDEVADAIVEESRAEDANDAKQHYHCYSLDASPGMENHFPEQAVSPEDILMEKETEREQEAARALMMERLREALATLTPRQASCLHARFWKGKPFKEIAEAEGFTTSAAIVTVRNAIQMLEAVPQIRRDPYRYHTECGGMSAIQYGADDVRKLRVPADAQSGHHRPGAACPPAGCVGYADELCRQCPGWPRAHQGGRSHRALRQ